MLHKKYMLLLFNFFSLAAIVILDDKLSEAKKFNINYWAPHD